MRLRWLVLAVGVVVVAAGCARPGPYPSGDIDLIVPAEAGDATDMVARIVAPCLGDQLGVEVVVRNVPGENGVVGNQALVDAKPNGYTLMISSVSPTAVTPVLAPERTGYLLEDFLFVGVVRSAPVVLFTAADSPVDAAQTLLAAAKGSALVKVAHRGDDTVEGFTLWLMNFLGETDLESAPVDSDAEIVRGVVAGDYDAGLATLTPELLSSIESGEVRLLGSGAHLRPRYLRQAPTLYQVLDRTGGGLPDLMIDTAISVPFRIGEARYAKLATALEECLRTDDVMRDLGPEFVPMDQIGHGEQWSRYWDLQRGVQLGLNLPKIE